MGFGRDGLLQDLSREQGLEALSTHRKTMMVQHVQCELRQSSYTAFPVIPLQGNTQHLELLSFGAYLILVSIGGT